MEQMIVTYPNNKTANKIRLYLINFIVKDISNVIIDYILESTMVNIFKDQSAQNFGRDYNFSIKINEYIFDIETFYENIICLRSNDNIKIYDKNHNITCLNYISNNLINYILNMNNTTQLKILDDSYIIISIISNNNYEQVFLSKIGETYYRYIKIKDKFEFFKIIKILRTIINKKLFKKFGYSLTYKI